MLLPFLPGHDDASTKRVLWGGGVWKLTSEIVTRKPKV